MAETIYEAGDVQGYDFAFDAAGQIIDWSRVAQEAERRSVRLSLSLGMLFTLDGEVRQNARASVTIPKGADETIIKQYVYTRIREYVRTVARRILRQEAEEEGEEVEEIAVDADVSTPNTVALISAVSMQ